jgi:uncharacterized membrane protein
VAAHLVAALVAQALYVYFIVPELPVVSSVPLGWWLGASVPVLVIGFLLGLLSCDARQYLLVVVGGAVGCVAYLQYAFASRQLGFGHTSPDPIVLWTVGLLMTACSVSVTAGLGRLAKLAVRSARRSRSPGVT